MHHRGQAGRKYGRQKGTGAFFRDTGPGTTADGTDHLFDPFYTTKALGNTGLGLSISKGIIDMHGGIIYAYSEMKKVPKLSSICL
ncbi:MAG: HAMP domain-containing histidine kinase [Smithella sp.]|nr:HAMP domain-containing histidine kinase [Smithella sp.]